MLTQDVTDFDDGRCFKVVCESAATLDDIDTALEKIKVSHNSGIFGDYCIISEALEYAVNRSDSFVNNYIFDYYNQEEAIFEDKTYLENYFYFDDDNYILWILFTEDDGREYNFALK